MLADLERVQEMWEGKELGSVRDQARCSVHVNVGQEAPVTGSPPASGLLAPAVLTLATWEPRDRCALHPPQEAQDSLCPQHHLYPSGLHKQQETRGRGEGESGLLLIGVWGVYLIQWSVSPVWAVGLRAGSGQRAAGWACLFIVWG